MFEALPENPQTIGDLVGKAVRLVRDNARLLIAVLLWPSIITCAAMSGFRLIFEHLLRAQLGDLNLLLFHGFGILAVFAFFAYAQWELMLRGLAIMRFCMGYAPSYQDAYLYAHRRWVALVCVYTIAVSLPAFVLLFWLIIVVAVILIGQQNHLFPYGTIVPFAIIGLLLTLTMAWSFLVGSMMLSVLACEDLPVMQVVKRGEDLSMRYLWRGGSYMCFLGIVLLVLSLALDVPLLVVAGIDFAIRGVSVQPGSLQLPIYLEILTPFWGGLLNIVLLAVALLADALYYYDLCLRLDGLDIKTKLARLN